MKKIALALFFLAALYALAFAAGKWRRMHPASLAKEKKTLLDSPFHPTDYPSKDHPFVVIVVGSNPGAFVEKNLCSIFSQHYPNFRLIYVDDASEDGSFELVQNFVQERGQFERVSLFRNEESLGELASLYFAIQSCLDEEIVVWVEGNDWLSHEWVLSRLNAYYADPDLWLTFGQYREFPQYQLGSSKPFCQATLEEKGFRGHPFVSSHLKTFYAGLFKQIQEVDFSYQGTFLKAATESAVMIPLLELAKDHFRFIPEILYIANPQNFPPADRETVLRSERYIRALSAYDPLPFLDFSSEISL